MQVCRRHKHLIVAFAILLLALLLIHRAEHHSRGNAAQTTQEVDDGQELRMRDKPVQPSLNRDPETGEIIWRVGKPKPALAVVRGANKQRRFGTPVTRELPEVIPGSLPAVMAMTPADGRLELLPEEIDLYTLKSRRMVFNPEALDRVLNGETNHIMGPTPGSEVLDLKIDAIRTRTKHTHSLIGKIAGEELSNVNLVYHDGIVYGTISRHDKNQHIEYQILADGHMMVREIDTAAITDVCGNPGAGANHECDANCKHEAAGDTSTEGEAQAPTPTVESAPPIERATAGWTTIDVVVGYGTEARIAAGGVSQIEARIIDSVDQMTLAFSNSLVTNTEVMLLGTIEDPDYVFPGSLSSVMDDELDGLNDHSDGLLDAVSNYSNLLGADLTAFICKQSQGGTAGLAFRPGRSSVTALTALFPSVTFAHELGHNLGARHSWGDSGDTETNSSRFGLRFEGTGGTRYRTIMAYSESYGGSRIPHYSNPNVSYDGTPTGLATGSNQTGNTKIDPAYISGGFDGSNPNLGARNAEMFLVAEGSNGVAFASNRSTRTGLGVTSPVASVQWSAGSTQTISFTGGDMEYTADIDLYKGGVYQYTIANDIDAIDHSFNWNIPLAQQGGNNYQIRVTLTHTDTLATSFAESGFFVIQGTAGIILESPIGGETWTRNTKKSITWSSTYGGNVKIEYIKGAAAPVTIVNSTPDDGLYEWTIPFNLTTGADYKIKITSDVSPFDSSQSAGPFTISAPSNNILVTSLDSDPGFVTSGEFEYGTPGGTNDASSPNTGTKMYDTNLIATSFGTSRLTTNAIDCSNHANVKLEFWTHVYIASGYTAVFEVSNDNSNWTELFSQTNMIARSWNKHSYDISSVADRSSTVYVRWSVVGSGGQYGGGGMAIDDISITGDFIPADGFEVISPDGGETLSHDLLTQITWLSEMGGNADIELLKNGSFHSTIATNTPNDGVFYWLVPDTLVAAGDYKIRIKSSTDATRTNDSAANFSIAASTSTIYFTDLESDPGFSTTGDWEWGQPSGNNAASSARSGTKMYDTLLSATSFATSVLTTHAIDCSSYTGVNLQFYAHIKHLDPYFTARFEVSNNGTTWTTLFEQTGLNSGQWVLHNYNISAVADGKSTVYVRWNQIRNGGSVSQYGGGGIAIDDITVSGTFIPSLPTYDTWAQGPAAGVDSNGDGIKNGVAWVIGAASTSANARSLRPIFDNDSDPDYAIFTYRRTDEANNDPNTTIGVEYGSNLSSWTTAVHDGNNVKITETNDFYGTGVDRVRVELKKTLASGSKLFSRLKVDVTE